MNVEKDIQDENGYTALMHCVSRYVIDENMLAFVELLIEEKDIKNNDKKRAIDIALKRLDTIRSKSEKEIYQRVIDTLRSADNC